MLDINESNPFYLYASYFYALSAYETGDIEMGMEALRGIRATHPKWERIAEVEVWYGKMLLEEGDLFKGIEILNSIESEEVKPLAEEVKSSLLIRYDSIPLLQKAIELNPYDKILAQHLANKISRQPLVERKVGVNGVSN